MSGYWSFGGGATCLPGDVGEGVDSHVRSMFNVTRILPTGVEYVWEVSKHETKTDVRDDAGTCKFKPFAERRTTPQNHTPSHRGTGNDEYDPESEDHAYAALEMDALDDALNADVFDMCDAWTLPLSHASQYTTTTTVAPHTTRSLEPHRLGTRHSPSPMAGPTSCFPAPPLSKENVPPPSPSPPLRQHLHTRCGTHAGGKANKPVDAGDDGACREHEDEAERLPSVAAASVDVYLSDDSSTDSLCPVRSHHDATYEMCGDTHDNADAKRTSCDASLALSDSATPSADAHALHLRMDVLSHERPCTRLLGTKAATHVHPAPVPLSPCASLSSYDIPVMNTADVNSVNDTDTAATAIWPLLDASEQLPHTSAHEKTPSHGTALITTQPTRSASFTCTSMRRTNPGARALAKGSGVRRPSSTCAPRASVPALCGSDKADFVSRMERRAAARRGAREALDERLAAKARATEEDRRRRERAEAEARQQERHRARSPWCVPRRVCGVVTAADVPLMTCDEKDAYRAADLSRKATYRRRTLSASHTTTTNTCTTLHSAAVPWPTANTQRRRKASRSPRTAATMVAPANDLRMCVPMDRCDVRPVHHDVSVSMGPHGACVDVMRAILAELRAVPQSAQHQHPQQHQQLWYDLVRVLAHYHDLRQVWVLLKRWRRRARQRRRMGRGIMCSSSASALTAAVHDDSTTRTRVAASPSVHCVSVGPARASLSRGNAPDVYALCDGSRMESAAMPGLSSEAYVMLVCTEHTKRSDLQKAESMERRRCEESCSQKAARLRALEYMAATCELSLQRWYFVTWAAYCENIRAKQLTCSYGQHLRQCAEEVLKSMQLSGH